MKAQTRKALQDYVDKFGKAYEYDPKIKNSQESALVAEIEEAMKKRRVKKVAEVVDLSDV